MKIAIVNKHPEDVLGGSEIQCDIIASGLQQRGHDVVYIAVGGARRAYSSSYEVVQSEGTASSVFEKVIAARPEIVYWRSCRYLFPDYIKFHSGTSIPIIFAVSNRYDIKVFDSLWVYGNKLRAIKECYRLIRQRWAIKQVDGATTLNPDYLRPIPNRNKVTVLNGMDLPMVSEQFVWPRPYCIWVANLKEWKRPEQYIKLSKELADVGVDFLMVGRSGPAYRWITDNKKDKRIPPNFYYLGGKSLNEVNDIIRSSMLHIHTCHPEGFGNVFIQAWLNAKPSISLGFDPGGFLSRERIGFNAHNSFSAFAETTRLYIDNKELRRATGERAFRFASHAFAPALLAENLEKFMFQILGTRKNRVAA